MHWLKIVSASILFLGLIFLIVGRTRTKRRDDLLYRFSMQPFRGTKLPRSQRATKLRAS